MTIHKLGTVVTHGWEGAGAEEYTGNFKGYNGLLLKLGSVVGSWVFVLLLGFTIIYRLHIAYINTAY